MNTGYEIIHWKRFGKKAISFIVKPVPQINGDLELLSIFIEEIDNSASEFFAEMARVENGEVEEGSWSGNMVCATYHKDKAYLEFFFDSPRTCELPTSMLKELVEAWVREKAKFDAENKK